MVPLGAAGDESTVALLELKDHHHHYHGGWGRMLGEKQVKEQLGVDEAVFYRCVKEFKVSE